MKFSYNQSDISTNISITFYQNPIHSYPEIGFNSKTDKQIGEREKERAEERGTNNRNRGHSKDCDNKQS